MRRLEMVIVDMENRIPKIIHYCWFGGNPLPECAQKCINSWKKYCPDYEIKEWNETNIDLTSVDYMREAYEARAWAFVSDVARLQIIYEQGGIYLDTDVEILKSFDSLLCNCAYMGIEDDNVINLGLGFGAMRHHPLIKELLDDYQARHFRRIDGTLDQTPIPALQNSAFIKHGFNGRDTRQTFCNTTIYPSEFFSPKSFKTGRVSITENTYSIHHYDGSWLTSKEKKHIATKYQIYQKWGVLASPIWVYVWCKNNIKQEGLIGAAQLAAKKLKSACQ